MAVTRSAAVRNNGRNAPASASSSPKGQHELLRRPLMDGYWVRYDANLIPLYTLSEDLADGVIHFVGVTGALVASYSLLTEAWSSLPETKTHEDWEWFLGLAAYAFCVLARPSRISTPLTLTCSAVYNIVGCGLRKHCAILRRLDHAAIYFTIAGSYTPFMVVHGDKEIPGLGGLTCFNLLGIVWACALGAACLKLFQRERWEKTGLFLYLGIGGVVIVIAPSLGKIFSDEAVREVIQAGMCILFGLTFYLWDALLFSNVFWHSCVLAGIYLHFGVVKEVVLRGHATERLL